MTRIGVFRYNEMVDSNSQILLRRSTSLSLMELREEILALPYRDRGKNFNATFELQVRKSRSHLHVVSGQNSSTD